MTAPVVATAHDAPFVEPRPARRALRRGSLPPLRGLLPLAVLLSVWQVTGSERSPYFPPPWPCVLPCPCVSACLCGLSAQRPENRAASKLADDIDWRALSAASCSPAMNDRSHARRH